MYSSSLFQFYETRQRKLWKWWHIYKQHVILIRWGALVAYVQLDSKECRSVSWRYHTGRFICENSIAQGDLDRGEYFLLSGRYSPLDLYHHIGLKSSPSIYQLLTFPADTVSANQGFHLCPTDQEKFHLTILWPFFTVPGQKKPFQSHFVPFFWNKTWVTFSIFWHIAGLLLSQGRDSRQTVMKI